ncbi:MAG TPA: hypothetical protein VHC22_33710 [Pirellulales bacterium]|nr:hypothetical protein [Pirellulales bacterium]
MSAGSRAVGWHHEGIMRRRFQFSLRTVMAIMSLVAIACAIWVKLPMPVRVAIGTASMGVFFWAIRLVFWLLPDDRDVLDWIVRGGSKKTNVIKRRSDQQ